jgi:hypothetical protein
MSKHHNLISVGLIAIGLAVLGGLGTSNPLLASPAILLAITLLTPVVLACIPACRQ